MPTLAQVEEQIFVCEGFRVRLTPLQPKTKTIPAYDFVVMAPQKWRVSDWKNVRLIAYMALLREAVVLRGDGAPVKGDLQLGGIRDTYYASRYGSLEPHAPAPAEVIALAAPIAPIETGAHDESGGAARVPSRRGKRKADDG